MATALIVNDHTIPFSTLRH